MAATGILRVYVYPRIEPFVLTPCLLSATSSTSAGISYSQATTLRLTTAMGTTITVARLPTRLQSRDFSQTSLASIRLTLKPMDFEEGLEKGPDHLTPEEVLDSSSRPSKRVSIPGFKAADGRCIHAANGTGMECVTRIKEIGVNDVDVVPERAEPDGNFPTCSYPNPKSSVEALDASPACRQGCQLWWQLTLTQTVWVL